jgi:hypothetical protein
MRVTSPSGESKAGIESDVELMGWGVFWVFGVVCGIASYSLYWWNVNLDVIHSRGWIAGLFCAPTYVLACVGFIQGVSRVPCVRLRKAWPTLKSWQRLLILSFTGGAASLLALYAYFLASLTTTLYADTGSL